MLSRKLIGIRTTLQKFSTVLQCHPKIQDLCSEIGLWGPLVPYMYKCNMTVISNDHLDQGKMYMSRT
jgi:hypothetical protein